jgi:hypothetical protein
MANREAVAPRTLQWAGGRSKKFETVTAHGAAATDFCKLLAVSTDYCTVSMG